MRKARVQGNLGGSHTRSPYTGWPTDRIDELFYWQPKQRPTSPFGSAGAIFERAYRDTFSPSSYSNASSSSVPFLVTGVKYAVSSIVYRIVWYRNVHSLPITKFNLFADGGRCQRLTRHVRLAIRIIVSQRFESKYFVRCIEVSTHRDGFANWQTRPSSVTLVLTCQAPCSNAWLTVTRSISLCPCALHSGRKRAVPAADLRSVHLSARDPEFLDLRSMYRFQPPFIHLIAACLANDSPWRVERSPESIPLGALGFFFFFSFAKSKPTKFLLPHKR